MNAAADPSA